MRFDRRRFIHIGAAGALATLAGCKKGPETPPTTAPATNGPVAAAAGAELQVDFEGLYIIEGQGANTKVRMIDGPAIGVPTHTLTLKALLSAIDQGNSSPPDSTQAVGSDTRWIYNLAGNDVLMPKADSGPDTLDPDPPSPEDPLATPSTEPGWHSLKRVPDLHEICGATKVTNLGAVASSVSLKHGKLTVLQPIGVGATSVWKFVKKTDGSEINPPGQKSVSNRVRYIRKNTGNPLVIEIGTGPSAKKITFKQGVTTQVMITNLMPPSGPCPAPCTPNMNHFEAFMLMVDKAFDAKALLVSFTPPSSPVGIEPDYCPGSRV